ncbi:hypothetical protein SH1V18_47330 [Vallitalea longa]|uniref:Endoribonuclease L-PSP/chorismate mutase-like domain-containing protein n=1 Tax=Vallitalea longa TaxID=2936439 RepID=A0A9W6DI90_9FIRM|nr:RidA family protein [Vallitalea longa]GKX32253.1 hypothetical protein SH1V18_47330 [Vallitalea longa]
MNVYENLKKMNIELPKAPPLGGVYTPVKRVGNLLFTAGQGATKDGIPTIAGKVGKDLTIEQGKEAAKGACLNMLSCLHAYTGDLNKIKNVVKILGFVASAEGFADQPQVMNGASQFLVDVFGDKGQHARSAIGTNELPGGLAVEIEGIFEIEE